MGYFFSDEVSTMRALSFEAGQEDGKRLMKAAILEKIKQWMEIYAYQKMDDCLETLLNEVEQM